MLAPLARSVPKPLCFLYIELGPALSTCVEFLSCSARDCAFNLGPVDPRYLLSTDDINVAFLPSRPMDPRGLVAWGHGVLLRARVAPGVPNYAPRLMAATWLLTVFSAIFLGLRVYCKLSRGRRLWWDDHFLIASWVGARHG